MVREHPYLVEVAASFGRALRPQHVAFDGVHLEAELTQVPGEGAAPGTELQHALAALQLEGPQQVAARGAQVRLADPVLDREVELVRGRGQVACALQQPEELPFGLVAVGI